MNPNRGYRKSTLPENAKRVFEGKLFDTYQWEQKLYDGSTLMFERVTRPDTIVVYPVLPDGTILLVEDSQPDREMILTAPAGRIEEGETPEQAARRELKEETGHEAGELELLYAYQPYRKIDWVVHVFVARGCNKVGEPNLDPGEKITFHPVIFDQLTEMVVSGEYDRDGFDTLLLHAKLDSKKMEELKKKFVS
jgi:8-oxo-dGTP pyrophosphatase MutT (NUDIX family)